MTTIRPLKVDDLPRLREFWIDHWGGEFVITRGKIHRPEQVAGFVVEEGDGVAGLITFMISNDECEITSLDSLREGRGIGTTLIDKAVEEARAVNCRRIFLITTNDNLHALGFYQRRGFELVKIHRGAVNESRKVKLGISLIGENNIPLRDEIELEMMLKQAGTQVGR